MIDSEIKAFTWLKLPSDKYDIVPQERRVSTCQLEVSIDVDDLLICDPVDNKEKMAPLRVLSFDIECNIPDKRDRFSSPKSDSVIQIANMVTTYGQAVPFIRNVFTLGSCSAISGTQVLSFEDEKDLLMAWHKFFVEVDPDVVIGYNITQFDIPYLLCRSRTLKLPEFPFLGRIKASPQRMPVRDKTLFLECPGYEGRLILDVYHHIRERFPDLQGEGIYKLNGVSMHFLGQRKEDIDYLQIPALQNGNADSRRDLAVYCLKDVYLPLLLFEKLKCLETEVKDTKEVHVPFNVMRVWRPCIEIAKQCLHAIQYQYVTADK
ncbi:unnamed protein product [Cyclocybe aegerita]|uniref:DNA polymerase delta catalytic subunit n=1 Tax=Cyclocybe aegerita TaxID=1973307 RepID=A0A8S0WZV2_CYCAE|nr:unnamed protein product [Cyclocybe aegerita]